MSSPRSNRRSSRNSAVRGKYRCKRSSSKLSGHSRQPKKEGGPMADYLSLVAAANAAAYDRYLGPPQFEPYARDLAGRLGAMTDGDLLETAAGTGVLTRVLA